MTKWCSKFLFCTFIFFEACNIFSTIILRYIRFGTRCSITSGISSSSTKCGVKLEWKWIQESSTECSTGCSSIKIQVLKYLQISTVNTQSIKLSSTGISYRFWWRHDDIIMTSSSNNTKRAVRTKVSVWYYGTYRTLANNTWWTNVLFAESSNFSIKAQFIGR